MVLVLGGASGMGVGAGGTVGSTSGTKIKESNTNYLKICHKNCELNNSSTL